MEFWQVIARRERLAGHYLTNGYAVPIRAHDPKGGYFTAGYRWTCPTCQTHGDAQGYGELGGEIAHHRDMVHA